MILVFGGTTEGKQIASFLDEVNTPYYYSTKTEVPFSGRGISIYGALTKIELEVFCRENNIKCIINASHPFAEQLHKMVASIEIQVPIIRYERLFTKRIAHQLITYVNTYEEAISFFQKGRFQSLLALSGVQTIEKLASFWKANKSWFRILDRESSRLIAQESGFPSSQLIYGYPQNKKEEENLFNDLKPSVIFTKESGINGKLDQKISAAISTKTPLVILKKPLLSNRYLCIHSINELIEILNEDLE